jgi:zinc/manganese transport system substrate-binding protein
MRSASARRSAEAIAIGLALVISASAVAASPSRIGVVAAENFYGDIVGQLAGDRVALTSILSNPTVDPHAYETTARDAAAVANARLVIQNGLGYDTFVDRLVAASPNPHRTLLVVARLTGRRSGDNPHLWYDPATMPALARAVVEVLVRADPAGAAFYRDRHRAVQASLRALARTVGALKARYAGTPVAATEPVFTYMAQAIGLTILTPVAFQKTIEEGEDPPAAATARMEDQLRTHRVRLLLYNTQTVSPVTARMQQLAREVGVPVVGVSETEPPGRSFQQWMLGQLEAVDAALARQK